ncbi:MAG TPA: DUF1786 domain-containing protein [Methanocella sp.]|nr:DUF1786 domain-containing protein [Methanocella sp.]
MFAVDVGSGTQDVLLADAGLRRPYLKMVLPAPTQLYAAKVRRLRRDLFCDGYTMGGGALTWALRRHAERHRVVMTPAAARTVRDDLEQVRAMGIEIGKESDLPAGHTKLTLMDVDMDAFRAALETLNYGLPKEMAVAVAVQDHGVAPKGVSDRQFRFRQIERKVRRGATFRDFVFTGKTGAFSRVSAVIQSLRDQGYDDVLVMDTKIAGIYGGLYGVRLPAVAVDLGNGHTTAATVAADGTIVGVFEHHTLAMSPADLRRYIERLVSGTVTNEEVFEDGGHGAFVKEAIEPKAIVATGPRRKLILKTGLDVKLATPLDDVYMAGPVGMIRAYRALREGKE